jgi:hypothetical protein
VAVMADPRLVMKPAQSVTKSGVEPLKVVAAFVTGLAVEMGRFFVGKSPQSTQTHAPIRASSYPEQP